MPHVDSKWFRDEAILFNHIFFFHFLFVCLFVICLLNIHFWIFIIFEMSWQKSRWNFSTENLLTCSAIKMWRFCSWNGDVCGWWQLLNDKICAFYTYSMSYTIMFDWTPVLPNRFNWNSLINRSIELSISLFCCREKFPFPIILKSIYFNCIALPLIWIKWLKLIDAWSLRVHSESFKH